jgi:hypothetical protein
MSKYIQDKNLNILWNTICKIENISKFCSKEKLNEIFNNVVNYYYNEIKDTKITLNELQNLNRNTICSIIEELNKYKEIPIYETHSSVGLDKDEKVISTDEWNNLIERQTQERNETIRELFPQPISGKIIQEKEELEQTDKNIVILEKINNITKDIVIIKEEIKQIFLEIEKLKNKT